MEVKSYDLPQDDDINIILGMSHFIKTVDDLSEIISTTVPGCEYAVVFNEASGPALVRYEGNSEELIKRGIDIMQNISAGHSFIILLKKAFPINVLSKVKNCDEVVRIFCATANPVTVLFTENERGRGIVGVIDGVSPQGVESDDDKKVRRDFLRKIGYKF